MKKLIILIAMFLIVLPLSPTRAADPIVRITSMAHQTFTGQFRNDELAQKLTPSGELGLLVYTPRVDNKTWVIDPALIDEAGRKRALLRASGRACSRDCNRN